MKWLRRILLAAAILLALACSLAGLAFLYTYHYISTPPVQTSDRTLQSWLRSASTNLKTEAPWETIARQDQTSPLDIAAFIEPPLRFGPWTRWWWPGNLVNEAELQREMRMFADVGIAGVEIQSFAISVPQSDKESSSWTDAGWDSPLYYQNLATVMETARQLGMGVDLNNGSGWPTGNPYVALEDGLLQLLHSEIVVTGPADIEVDLPAPQMPAATFGAGALGMLGDAPMQTFVPQARKLVAVVAARITDDRRTWQPWDFLDQMALDVDSIQVITDSVSANRLVWSVPSGDWAVAALWQLPGGELIAGGYAHPQPGYVVDHLDAQRIRANQDYLFRDDSGLAKYFGDPLRAFFNDSLEFRQERHWARGHLQEFESRIGYDPRPWLAALIEPGKDQMPFHAANIETASEYDLGERGTRFIEDWDEVTSDLFRERYFQTLADWASEHGLAHRLQAYGGPTDIIRAAGESDIPETEQLYAGGSEMFMKTVSSGAHIAGKPLVSAESFIFLGRAFMTTPAKIKALADKAFAAGVNQLVYHGTAYRVENPAERGYPVRDGWYPWQLGMLSTDYSENWSYWQHAGQLNRYIARNQYLLRKGEPETDVLVLYPGQGFPQGYNNPDEPFDQGRFDGEEALTTNAGDTAPGRGVQRMRDIWRETRKLEKQGLTWEWINEQALNSASFEDGVLQVGQLRARGILLHGITAVGPDVAENLATLVEEGLPVKVSGNAPLRQHGLRDWENGDLRVSQAFLSMPTVAAFAPGPIQFTHPQVKSLRRRLANGDLIQFFSNPAPQATTLMVQLSQEHPAAWLDAWLGTTSLAVPDDSGRISLDLPAYGSITLWLPQHAFNELAINELAIDRLKIVASTALNTWSVSVVDSGFSHAGELPGDWLQIPELLSSGKPGVYTTTFTLPPGTEARRQQGHRFEVTLGKLFGAATVRLNNIPVGAALVPPYTVPVNSAVRSGENHLEITLTPPRKNRLVTAIENGEPGWDAPDIIGTSARVSAGLIGPVHVIERAITQQ